MRIVSANVYARNREVDQASQRLEDTNAVGIGAQEAWQFGTLAGYSKYVGAGGRGAQEVPVFLRRRGTTYRGHGAYFVKPDLGTPITPDRWVTWVRFTFRRRRWVLINTHADAALQQPDGDLTRSARVRWAETHMRQLVREVRRQRRDGYRPLVTGDFNYFPRAGQTDPWRWSPHVALTRVGLHYQWHRLDGIAVPARLEAHELHDFHLPGSDHRAVSVRLDVPPRRGHQD